MSVPTFIPNQFLLQGNIRRFLSLYPSSITLRLTPAFRKTRNHLTIINKWTEVFVKSPGMEGIIQPKWSSSRTVPEAISTQNKGRSRSAVQSILFVAPRCPRGSLVPYKSKENQIHPALTLQGRVPRWLSLPASL